VNFVEWKCQIWCDESKRKIVRIYM